MFQYGQVSDAIRIEHRHGDGSTAPMKRLDPHDPADPEREWQRGHVFVCTACHESVTVAVDETGSETTEAG